MAGFTTIFNNVNTTAMLTFEQFEESLQNNIPPQNTSVYLQSLWYDAKGNWNKAHGLVDNLSGSIAAGVHAYLHRVEGDKWNANYWYNKAGKTMPAVGLKEEWKELVQSLL